MDSRRKGSPGGRAFISKWLGLGLSALLCAPPALAVRPGKLSAKVVPAPQATGLIYQVTSTGNGGNVGSSDICDDGTGKCTLRAAMEAANAHAGTDAIRFAIPTSDPSCNPTTGACNINPTSALPDITDSVSIVGPGADKLAVRRDIMAAGFRIFNVTTSGEVTLAGMTISNGSALGGVSGGGVSNSGTGTVNVQSCAVTDNEATDGGGISNFNTGTVNVSHSLLARNVARGASSNCCNRGAGGGIANLSSGAVNVVNSTIVGNFAIGADPSQFTAAGSGQGGGVFNASGILNITNSTIANNLSTAPEVAQGSGGGVYTQSSAANLKSTIVANNTAQTSGQDLFGAFNSSGYNFVKDTSDASIVQQATDIFGGDPGLGTLGSNGGPTQTMPLLAGSPAIDKGTSAGLTGPLSTDQRGAGFPRTVNIPLIQNAQGGDGTDMGAFEAQPLVRFSSAAYSVNESTPSITITVKLTAALDDEATVHYATGNGTAVASKDYTSKSGTLTFAAGETARTFTVPILDDTLDEADETVSLKLSSPTGGISLGTPSTAVLKIVDDDPPPKLSINNVTVTEGDSGALNAAFTVTLSAASAKTVTAKYATANGTAKAPGDYGTKTGTLTFLAGQTSKTVLIGVRGDVLDEADETFFVNLSAPVNATLADAQGLCTITDDDPLPSLRINDVSVTEVDANTSNATLTVTLSRASGRTVAVNFATANGTASSSTDYVSKTGTVAFTAGQTTRTIVVQVRGDTLGEANETFFVNLSGAVNATIADAQGRVTILNDD